MPYAPNNKSRGVQRSSIKCWVCMLVAFLLSSLALLLAAFLTSNHVKVKYTIAGSRDVRRSRYGIWSSCTTIGSLKEDCLATKGYGPPFDIIHSQVIVILYLVSICLYLPSVVGLVIVAINVETRLLTSLVFITIFGSFGTLVAALGLFTWKVEHELSGTHALGSWTFTQTGVVVTYWWSYMLAWVAAGVLLLVLLNMVVLLCYQRRIGDEEEAEVRTQIRERDEKGMYNPSYKSENSMKVKRTGYPIVIGDIGEQTAFHPADVSSFESHTTRAPDYDSRSTSGKTSPQELQLQEEMFYRPNPPSKEMFKHQETIELRPRVVHQPTPFMNDISPDYQTDDDDRTYTVSQVIPASAVETGFKLEVGDTYLVSLNQQ